MYEVLICNKGVTIEREGNLKEKIKVNPWLAQKSFRGRYGPKGEMQNY